MENYFSYKLLPRNYSKKISWINALSYDSRWSLKELLYIRMKACFVNISIYFPLTLSSIPPLNYNSLSLPNKSKNKKKSFNKLKDNPENMAYHYLILIFI